MTLLQNCVQHRQALRGGTPPHALSALCTSAPLHSALPFPEHSGFQPWDNPDNMKLKPKLSALIALFLQVLITCNNLMKGNEAVLIKDLDMEKMNELARARTERYFVRVKTSTSTNIDQLWEGLEAQNPYFVWATLECIRGSLSEACLELLTPHFLEFYDQQSRLNARAPPVLVVSESSTTGHGRAIEVFRGSSQEEFIYFLQEASLRPILPTAASDRPKGSKNHSLKTKVALLVLTTQGFTRPEVWCPFLEKAKVGDITVFMHDKQYSLRRDGSSPSYYCHEGEDNIISVPTVLTQRATISCVRAAIQMIQYASLHYGGASSYILLSGDSVPLVSPEELVKHIFASNRVISRFELHLQQHQHETDLRASFLRPPNFLDGQNLIKMKQWFLLSEAVALALASPYNDFTRNFEFMPFVEEHYFVTIAQKIGVPFDYAPFMYDIWPKTPIGRPNNLKNVTSDVFHASGHLFARKVTNETNISLNWLDSLKESSKFEEDEL
jgi:hypothetical protein